MKVAVIIPNLNYAHWLNRALTSVYQQTHHADEVIVVDGGSLDNSKMIVESFGATWLETPPRRQADARNVGIASTSCELIVPLDADDWIDSTFIEKCYAKIVCPHVGIVGTGLKWPNGREQWPLPPFTRETFLTGNRLFSCSMFKRKCWEEVGGYNTARTYEDWLFWMEIVIQGWKVEVVPEALFHYFPHPNSSTTNMQLGQHAQYVQYILKKHGA